MNIGVVGAGVMGCGIAQAFAQAGGNKVVLCDVSEEAASAGKKKIQDALSKLAAKEKITKEAADKIAANITAGVKEALADCDLIIEAAVESMEIKKSLFKSLLAICKKDVIFATNTSSLSVTELSAAVGADVVGMHFFNPAPVMKLVEIVRGLNTSEEAARRVFEIARGIGKTPVEVKDNAGFIVNRLLVPMINEAVGVYADGTARLEDIDEAMKLGAGHPMGPLALGDLIGLDVCLAIMEVLQSQTGDPKYRAHPLLRKMVSGGRLGRKSSFGFYKYD